MIGRRVRPSYAIRVTPMLAAGRSERSLPCGGTPVASSFRSPDGFVLDTPAQLERDVVEARRSPDTIRSDN